MTRTEREKERWKSESMHTGNAVIITKSEFQTQKSLSSSLSWFCKQYISVCTWFGEWDGTCFSSVPSLWLLQGPSLLKHVPSTSCLHTLPWPLCLSLPFLTLSNWIASSPAPPPDTFLFLPLALSYHFSSCHPSFYMVFCQNNCTLINFKHLVSSLLMFCDMAVYSIVAGKKSKHNRLHNRSHRPFAPDTKHLSLILPVTVTNEISSRAGQRVISW